MSAPEPADKPAPVSGTPLLKDNQRQLDLVRQVRSTLHEDGLITDQEYADLAGIGSKSARRLEDYDDLRADLATAHARIAEAEKERDERLAQMNGFYLTIVERMKPFYPEGSRDLDWDVLLNVISKACKDRDTLQSKLDEAGKDSALLDKLDKLKYERPGGWDGKGDEPSYWRDPQAVWNIVITHADGTGQYPKELKELTLRAAISTTPEANQPKSDA